MKDYGNSLSYFCNCSIKLIVDQNFFKKENIYEIKNFNIPIK